MGLLDLLSKDNRQVKNRDKNIARSVNKYMQSPDRYRAMQALVDEASLESLTGLQKRFSMNSDKSIEDEEEKAWVCETLVSMGEAAMPAVTRYLETADAVSWTLRILEKIAENGETGGPSEAEVILKVLRKHPPGYERDPSKKIEFLKRLGSLTGDRAADGGLPEVTETLATYLEDMDEGVRVAAIEGLLLSMDEGRAKEPLLKLFVSDEEESLRIRRIIADGLAPLGWTVDAFKDAVLGKMPDSHKLDRYGQFEKTA